MLLTQQTQFMRIHRQIWGYLTCNPRKDFLFLTRIFKLEIIVILFYVEIVLAISEPNFCYKL